MRPRVLAEQIGTRMFYTGQFESPAHARYQFAMEMGYQNFTEMYQCIENDCKEKTPEARILFAKLREKQKEMRADHIWAHRLIVPKSKG